MGMDLDKVAGVAPAVDVGAVEEELRRYLTGERFDGEPWSIKSVGQADWALEQVAEADRRQQAYQDEIDLWTAAKNRLGAGAAWLRERLVEWALAQRTDKVKQFPLAHGTVATRATKAAIAVADNAAAIEWARTACPDAIKVEESFLVSKVGDAARIVEVITGYEAINQQTGEVERVPLATPEPVDDAKLAAVRANLGDGYTVNPLMDLAVHDKIGRPVPGLEVRPERVTATVTPLWA